MTKKDLTKKEMIEYLALWCQEQGVELAIDSTCGFGRPCVGIVHNGSYIDYRWYGENYEYADKNGEVWTPENAYHKASVLAVLGTGKSKTEVKELYEWVLWFRKNGFALVKGSYDISDPNYRNSVNSLTGRNSYARMVRK